MSTKSNQCSQELLQGKNDPRTKHNNIDKTDRKREIYHSIIWHSATKHQKRVRQNKKAWQKQRRKECVKKEKNMLRRVRFELTPFRTTDLGDRPKRSALDHSAIFPLLDSGPRLCTACMAIRNGILNFGLDTEGYPCNHCACMIRESQYPGFHYMWIPFPNGCVSWLMYRMFNHGSFDESSTQCCAERMLSGNSRL